MTTLSYTIQTLLEKMKNPDKDYRFMAVNDLSLELQGRGFKVGPEAEAKVVKAVLELLDDSNGEVQNLAVKCLPALVGKVREEQVGAIIGQLCSNMVAGKEQLRDVSIIGLKTTIQQMSVTAHSNVAVVTLLTDRTLAALNKDGDESIQLEVLDILAEVLGCYGNSLPSSHAAIQACLLGKLRHSRSAMRKRAIAALAKLVPCEDHKLFEALIKELLAGLGCSQAAVDVQTYVQCVTAINRSVGHRTGQYIPDIFPMLLEKANTDNDELRENCLQVIESFVVRCPTAVGQYLRPTTELALNGLSYDPNYDDDNNNSEEDAMDLEEQEEDTDDDTAGYSDDEDISWKVRRGSARLLAAVVSTQPELLVEHYRTVAPRLVARFREREENVKLEVFNALVALLRVAKVVVHTTDTAEDEMDTGESPRQQLIGLVPSIVKAIRTQFGTKKDRTQQGCFLVLKELVEVQPNVLAGHIGALVPGIRASLEGGKALTQLKLDCLAFLSQLLASHGALDIQPHVANLMGPMCNTVNDTFYKIQAEALHVCAALVKKMRPLDEEVEQVADYDFRACLPQLYATVMARFQATDVDQEVKEQAIGCMSCIIANMGDALGNQLVSTLPIYLDRMHNETTRIAAVRGLTTIAMSRLAIDLSLIFDETVKELAMYLRKNSRVLRLAALKCLASFMAHPKVPVSNGMVAAVLGELPQLVSDEDLQVTHAALTLNTDIIKAYPGTAASLKEDSPLLQRTLYLLQSPLLQGGALAAVTSLFAALTKLPSKPVNFGTLFRMVSQPIREAQDGETGTGAAGGLAVSRQACVSISDTLATITVCCPNEVSNVVDQFIADIRNPQSTDSVKLLALITLGGIGCHVDLSGKEEVKTVLEESLASQSEDVKSAAAVALGRVSVGNLQAYLPFILKEISSRPKRQYLLLHSLKEVICSEAATGAGKERLQGFVEELWQLLFESCGIVDEGTRNIVAECLGELVVVNPELLLPRLESKLESPEAHVRTTSVTAVKFTVTDQPQPLDRLLKPVIAKCLAHIQDENLGVRRVALVTLNSAAHNKPSLIADLLEKYLPILYGETVERAEYKREVQMGPFKHTIDDGLDIRKAAFECMYTLLDWCMSLVPLDPFITQICMGLRDQYDIKLLTHLMLIRLSALAPNAVLLRLGELVPPLQETITKRTAQQTVKQEVEKSDELKRSALRAVVALCRIPDAKANAAMAQLLAQLEANDDLKARMEAVQKDSDVLSRTAMTVDNTMDMS